MRKLDPMIITTCTRVNLENTKVSTDHAQESPRTILIQEEAKRKCEEVGYEDHHNMYSVELGKH